jgi:hypothetical protein
LELFENIFLVVKENKISILEDFASPAIKELILEKKVREGRKYILFDVPFIPFEKIWLKMARN